MGKRADGFMREMFERIADEILEIVPRDPAFAKDHLVKRLEQSFGTGYTTHLAMNKAAINKAVAAYFPIGHATAEAKMQRAIFDILEEGRDSERRQDQGRGLHSAGPAPAPEDRGAQDSDGPGA